MAQDTAISWAMHTHNEWIGCEEAGPECDHCYARKWNERFKKAVWGKGGRRHLTAETTRMKPYIWDRAAAAAGEIHVVFSASLSDWADTAVPEEWRFGLFRRIHDTPNLFWMLLTKRPKAACERLMSDDWWMACFGEGWQDAKASVMSRIAIGTSAGTRKTAAARLPWLWKIRGLAGIFVSMAPLLERVDLSDIRLRSTRLDFLNATWTDATGVTRSAQDAKGPYTGQKPFVILEGESGSEETGNRPIRPLHPDLARFVRDQCAASGVVFHLKQLGEFIVPEDGSPACRVCGCTWNNACPPDRSGHTCHWVVTPDMGGAEGPLCSSCKGKSVPAGERPVRYQRVGTKAAGHLLDGRAHLDPPDFLPANARISSGHPVTKRPLARKPDPRERRHAG